MSEEKRKYKNDGSESFMLVLGIILILVAGFFFFAGYETSHDAVIEGRLVSVVARAKGNVLNVYVEDNQEVKKGDLLVEIDSQAYQLALKEAETELNNAKVRLLMCERPDREEIVISDERRQCRSLIDSKYGFSRSELDKLAKMFSGNVQKRKDKLNPKYNPNPKPRAPQGAEVARQYQMQAMQNNRMMNGVQTQQSIQVNYSQNGNNQVNPNNSQLAQNPNLHDVDVPITEEEEEDYALVDTVELREQIKELESKVANCKLNLSYTKIYATQDGTISSRNVQVGDLVEVGQEIVSLVPKRVWVVANYPSSKADKMHVGQNVYIKIEDYPRRFFKGMVESVDDFDSVAKMEGAEEEMNTGTVPVRIVFTKDYSEFNFVPGMAASTSVKVN